MSTAIITGASSGIGEAASKRLLQDGWNVILISRSTDKMQDIVKGYDKYKIIPCDLSQPELILSEVMPSIKSYLKNNSLSGIDLLLNNAGGIRPERVSKQNLLSSFKWHIDLMLTTPYLSPQKNYLLFSLRVLHNFIAKKKKNSFCSSELHTPPVQSPNV